ncbi:MAG TPA: HepT-like ribonuclease domain-containing protein [Longimicrobium sp.]|jgi:hypothetical protein
MPSRLELNIAVPRAELDAFCRRNHVRKLSFFGSVLRDDFGPESASKVTAETRAAHPGVPWSVITAVRNRLIHGYFDIDFQRVWDTTRADLPVPIAELERILASDLPD